ncbi:MAG: hypothetical protein AB7V22_12705 [Kiritimatiellia bacterium]
MKTVVSIAALMTFCLEALAADVKVYLDSTNGSSAFIVYDAQSNELMRVLSDGRVGVGTVNPGNDLHVAGVLRVDTAAESGHGIMITEIPEPEGPGWPIVASSDGITVVGQGDAELVGGYGNAELKCQADGTIALEGADIEIVVSNWGQGPFEGTQIIRIPEGTNSGLRAIYHSGLLWRMEEY